MASGQSTYQWRTLDKDLRRIVQIENATQYVSRPMVGAGIALAFIVVAALGVALFFGQQQSSLIVVAAAAFGAYMALNIGANDVANNMGPAVGASALTMGGAIVIAAVFESAGALLAGGDVVSTISKGIIDPASVNDVRIFVWAMMAALISAALWVNLATIVGAPVSTTHSVVRRGDGGRDRGRRVWRGELADDEQDRRQLGDLAGSGRGDRGSVPGIHQIPDHVPR